MFFYQVGVCRNLIGLLLVCVGFFFYFGMKKLQTVERTTLGRFVVPVGGGAKPCYSGAG